MTAAPQRRRIYRSRADLKGRQLDNGGAQRRLKRKSGGARLGAFNNQPAAIGRASHSLGPGTHERRGIGNIAAEAAYWRNCAAATNSNAANALAIATAQPRAAGAVISAFAGISPVTFQLMRSLFRGDRENVAHIPPRC